MEMQKEIWICGSRYGNAEGDMDMRKETGHAEEDMDMRKEIRTCGRRWKYATAQKGVTKLMFMALRSDGG